MAARQAGRGRRGLGGGREGPVYDVTALLSAIEAVVASRVVSSFLARRSGAWEEGGKIYVDERGLRVILDYASTYERAIRIKTGKAAVDLVTPANGEARRRLEAIAKRRERPGGAQPRAPNVRSLVDGIKSWGYEDVMRVVRNAMASGGLAASDVLLLSGGPANFEALVGHAEASAPKAPGLVIVVSAFNSDEGKSYIFYIMVREGLIRGIAASVVPGDTLHGDDAMSELTKIRGPVHVKVYIASW